MHRITFESPFNFGDRVEFTSQNGSGRGRVSDIVVGADRSVYYIIKPDDSLDLVGGIYPNEMRLIEAAPADAEPAPDERE
jgi:hypothetical protein